MSETKFTNGPWRFHAGSIVSPECDDIPDGYCIASIEDDGGYEAPPDQRVANGHLMAASTELYDVLQMYVSAYSLGFPSPNILVEAGQKALAKARGEA